MVNDLLFKKTLGRTLKWYPVVVVVMVILGIVIAQMKGDPVLAVILAVLGGIVGPALEAFFYYQAELKKEREAGLAAGRQAELNLRQATELFKAGLIQEAEYERIRQSVAEKLPPAAEAAKTEVRAAPAQGSPGVTGMKINPWLAMLVAMSWPMMGMLVAMVLGMLFDLELSKLARSIINLAVNVVGFFFLFFKVYAAPFGPIPFKDYLQRLGIYWPKDGWRHLVLGVILAGCTLSGMLGASLLTGRYVLDWNNLNLDQFVFSLSPGIFEEIFYRGMIMMLLLSVTKSVKKAFLGQVLIFGLAHIKGVDLMAFVEVLSVMIIAVAFTYAAYKTRALVAGMVFHFLHDAFLFFVQPPEATYIGITENVIFYALLWGMVGMGCAAIWFATERLQIRGERELYTG